MHFLTFHILWTLLLAFTLARQYATTLQPLLDALQKTGSTVVDLPSHQQTTMTDNVPPLVVLPCDLINFHRNIQQDWQLFAAEIDARPIISPLNVNPDCNCFNYRNIKWRPDGWTIIEHNFSAKQYEFEMIYLELIEQLHYTISSVEGHRTPYILYFLDVSDTSAYISYVISYFYERFQFVKFQLFYRHYNWKPEYKGPCYLGLDRLPLIKKIHFTIGCNYSIIPYKCYGKALTRVYRTTKTIYSVTFPNRLMRNVIPQMLKPLIYIKLTGSREVLFSKWSSKTDPGYELKIEVGDELSSIPKTWWIHEQSNSLLGYHKNFFAPDYLQTTKTVYSYARGNRHHYANGMYAKKPGVTYLRQQVTEHRPTTHSWPLPDLNWRCKLQQKRYCSPYLGDLEYHMLRALHTLKESDSVQHLCANYTTNFTSLQQIKMDYHQTAIERYSILHHTIFSFNHSLEPFLHGPLSTYTLDIKRLQNQLKDRIALRNLAGSNVQPKYAQLLKSVFLTEFIKETYTRYTFEHFKYNDLPTRFINQEQRFYYQHVVNIYHNNLVTMLFYFKIMRLSMYEQYMHTYAIKHTLQIIQHLQKTFTLQANIIYRHSFTHDKFFSTPIARILLPTHLNLLAVVRTTQRTTTTIPTTMQSYTTISTIQTPSIEHSPSTNSTVHPIITTPDHIRYVSLLIYFTHDVTNILL